MREERMGEIIVYELNDFMDHCGKDIFVLIFWYIFIYKVYFI